MSDYVSIGNKALNVRDACLSVIGSAGGGGPGGGGIDGGGGGGGRVGFVNPTGYNTAGMHGSIGVFLWDTDSVINQAVRMVGEVGANVSVIGGGVRVLDTDT